MVARYFTFILSLSLILQGCGEAKVASNEHQEVPEVAKKLRVYTTQPGSSALPHYDWPSGQDKPTGIEIELLEALMAECDLEFEYVTDFLFDEGDPRVLSLEQDAADIVIKGMTITKERSNRIDFTKPYYLDGLSALVRKNDSINTQADLHGKRIYTMSNVTAKEWIKENLKDVEIITELNSFKKPEELLELEEVDAFVFDKTVLNTMAAQTDQFVVVNEKFTAEPLALGVQKGDTALLNKLNAGIDALTESGKLEEIMKKFEL